LFLSKLPVYLQGLNNIKQGKYMKNVLRKEMLVAFREALPHGAIKMVAKKAGVHSTAVSGFLKGKNQSLRIEFAVLQVISEIRKERERLIKEAGIKA
jgi:hypothetical protein